MKHEWRDPTKEEMHLLRSALLKEIADVEALSRQLEHIRVSPDADAPPGFYLLPETEAPSARSLTKGGPVSVGLYHDTDGRLVEILLTVQGGRLYSMDIQKLGPDAPIYQAPWDADVSFSTDL